MDALQHSSGATQIPTEEPQGTITVFQLPYYGPTPLEALLTSHQHASKLFTAFLLETRP